MNLPHRAVSKHLGAMGRMSDAFAPMSCGLDLSPSLADLYIFGIAPIDYGPMLLLKPFGFRIAPDTLPSEAQ
jgi:hypothetical protein